MSDQDNSNRRQGMRRRRRKKSPRLRTVREEMGEKRGQLMRDLRDEAAEKKAATEPYVETDEPPEVTALRPREEADGLTGLRNVLRVHRAEMEGLRDALGMLQTTLSQMNDDHQAQDAANGDVARVLVALNDRMAAIEEAQDATETKLTEAFRRLDFQLGEALQAGDNDDAQEREYQSDLGRIVVCSIDGRAERRRKEEVPQGYTWHTATILDGHLPWGGAEADPWAAIPRRAEQAPPASTEPEPEPSTDR